MHGLIFDIQRGCTHDGPGIRTTVFLKGCPLRCLWCHNPESRAPHAEILFSPGLCIDCGQCGTVCPEGDARAVLAAREDGASSCRRCFACAAVCPSGALETAGREASCEEVLAEVLRDRVFYEHSGGGMTISGGEPLAQFAFTRALLEAARGEGVHTCVETCGYAPAAHLEALVPLVDLFLWDVKDTEPARHAAHTGAPLPPILDNLRRVDALGAATRLRCLLIDGVNLDEAHIDAVAGLCGALRRCEGVELLAYHPLGQAKRTRLGLPARGDGGEAPAPEAMAAAQARLEARGVRVLGP